MTASSCPNDETLAEFAEGALSGGDATQLAAHTESCESCRRVVAALVKLRSSRGAADEPDPETAPVVADGTTLGRYVVRRRVGAGAMGVVFEAHDPALDRRVAVKLLRGPATDDAQARLAREAQAMAKLSHRNVATVHDVGAFQGRNWVAMEFIDGHTLRAWLRGAKRTPQQILAVLLDAGRGLAAAHAQGVVHRDFKPDNVLVENTGRVVVSDFGLAASEAGDLAAAPEPASPLTTRTGALVGTPAYMAPELLAHVARPESARALASPVGDASARSGTTKSDQFAFCVTCVEAFSGRRPFDAPTLGALAARLQSAPPDATAMAEVPARIRRALERGLSLDPAARFPSMDTLLDALAPPRRERLALAGAAVIALVATLTVGAGAWSRANVCRGADDKVGAVWNDTIRARVHDAFVATKSPWAAAAAQGLSAGLDAWAGEWSRAWTDACEDTHVRREQSDELLDLRMQCLEERLAEVRALGPVLATADAETLSAASSLAQRLSPVSACADEKALRAPVRPPQDPAVAARVNDVRTRLAEVVALRAAARYRQARERADALGAEASKLGYRPLEAEVAVLGAQLEEDTDDFDKAVATLQRAQVAAQAGGHLLASGQAWAFLVRLEGDKRAHYAEAHHAAELAAAVTERLGSPPALEALLARNLGDVLSEEGKHAEAKAQYEKALALQRREDPRGVQVAATLNAIGSEVRELGDTKGALALHEEALALLTERLGARHPDVAMVQKNIGNVHWNASELDAAVEWYRKALELQEEAFGPDSLEVASTRNNVASVLTRQGKLDEAEKALRSVIAVMERRLGPEHAKLFGQLNNLAVVLRYTGHPEEAEQALRRALAIAEKAHGPEHEDVATTLINLGDVQLSRRDFKASVASYERAIAITAKTSGPEHANLADCYGGLAFPLIQLGEHARALTATERALAIYAKNPGIPLVEAQVHFAHAEAAWAVDSRRRADAVKEARAARDVLVKGGAQPSDLVEVDTWLKGK